MITLAQQGIERALERAVRHAREDSPRAVALLAQLQGRTLALDVSGLPLRICIESTGQTLRMQPIDAPDATISGAPLSLLALSGADPQTVITRGDVQISGNAEIAQQFRELALLMRPDLEQQLSRVMGRSGAHLAMRGMQAMRDWARSSAWTATQNAAEYLAHERSDLVSKSEAEHFLRGVDQLREQVDRADARLQRLEQARR